MNNHLTERCFASRSEASAQLASDLAELANSVIAKSGHASFVFSGGTTPAPMLEQLSAAELSWADVYVTISDERDVSTEDNSSNELMIRQSLLKGPAAKLNFTGLRDPQREARLEEFPKPVNAVVLGMGSDGHTASLFPGQPDLPELLASTNHSELVKRPDQDLDRITLTPSFLLNSNILVLLFFGSEKWAVYEAAKVGRDTSQYPVRCILNQEDVPVYTYWAP